MTAPDPPALTDADLDRLEALAGAASPAPWRAEGADIRCPHRLKQFRVAVVSLAFRGSAEMDADAEFIVAAREAVPALCAALREARARCEGLAERVAAQPELLSRRAERPG